MSSSPVVQAAITEKRGAGRKPVLPPLGPHSRAIDRGALGALIDGRSREGRFLRRFEAMLVEHVGGKPSVVQRALISRAARLALHMELMDERSLVDGHVFTEHDHNFYVSWSNALARLLARLGVGSPTDPREEDWREIVRELGGKAAA